MANDLIPLAAHGIAAPEHRRGHVGVDRRTKHHERPPARNVFCDGTRNNRPPGSNSPWVPKPSEQAPARTIGAAGGATPPSRSGARRATPRSAVTRCPSDRRSAPGRRAAPPVPPWRPPARRLPRRPVARCTKSPAATIAISRRLLVTTFTVQCKPIWPTARSMSVAKPVCSRGHRR